MKINIIIDAAEGKQFELHNWEREDDVEWSIMDGQYKLNILTDKGNKKIKKLFKSDNILESEEEIKQKFFEAVFEERMSQFISSEDGFDDASEEEEEQADKINPYDPRLIRVDTKNFSIHQVKEMIENDEIDLSPDFQRGFVWTDITRKSRLIESLLLRIPIPVFYLAQDEEGFFQVVDGVQRLTVINSFLNNEFKLKNLEYLTECNGKWFRKENVKEENNLQSIYTRRIEQTQLFFNIIDPQTPGKVKYDIFKRINTGGKALNNQEIRNCLANTKTREFLHELSRSDSFITATRGSVSHIRMADEELILRFIAFYMIDNGMTPVGEYKGGMDGLLDDTVELLNQSDIHRLKQIRIAFLNAMDGAYYLFGDKAFRKASYINKALFLGVSRVLSQYTLSEIKDMDKQCISDKMAETLKKDILFSGALSMATNDARNVNRVYNTVVKIVGEA